MYIEILYADLTRQRLPIDQAHLLPKTGVLAIILSCEDKKNPRITIDNRGYRRCGQVSGKDYYFLIYRRHNGKDLYGLDSKDEGDFVNLYNPASPWSEYATYKEHPRYHDFTMTFEGQQVSDEVWAEALVLFDKEIH